MKKSNSLLGAALVFFLACLVAFNFSMKAEYETGNYKDRYRAYATLPFKGFEAIEVNGAHRISVRISKGAHNVRVHEKAKEYLQIRQVGSKLVIEVEQKNENDRFYGEVLVALPVLTSLSTSSRYTMAGKPKQHLASAYFYNSISVEGFMQDSLQIQQDHATAIELGHNVLATLNVVAGSTPGSSSKLSIWKTNQIQAATLAIRNKSTLVLDNIMIPSINYQFSDSAQANFTGAALQLLSKNIK